MPHLCILWLCRNSWKLDDFKESNSVIFAVKKCSDIN